MLEADVLKYPTKAITSEQRAAFFANGSLVLESFVGNNWLRRLRHAVSERVIKQRITRSTCSNPATAWKPPHFDDSITRSAVTRTSGVLPLNRRWPNWLRIYVAQTLSFITLNSISSGHT